MTSAQLIEQLHMPMKLDVLIDLDPVKYIILMSFASNQTSLIRVAVSVW